jgi:hypothetical protein
MAAGSEPSEKVGRFGLVFQFDPFDPGTPEQRAELRSWIESWGFGTPRWRMLWYFARTYKAAQDRLWGGLEGSRHHVNIGFAGMQGWSYANAMTLPQWATGSDVRRMFEHEWAHQWDRYVLTPAIRNTLIEAIGTFYTWLGEPSDYFNQPDEIFCWSFQRLCDPDLPELPGGMSRALLRSVLPDWDQAWLDAGFEIND